jgi:hypothetical protein
MGKDVFVEKPISLVSSEAKEMTELAQNSGLILQVGHIFRFDPASPWMRDAIAAGRFGQLKVLRARFSGFKRPRHDTGVTFADSIHFVATLDADLQNDPEDLPAMPEALKMADCVCETRAATRGKGDNWIRIASSWIANWVRNKLSGENISDAGCTYRVFQTRMHRAREIFQRCPSVPSDIDQDGGIPRGGSSSLDKSTLLGHPSLRCLESFVQIIPRRASRPLDEISTNPIRNRRIEMIEISDVEPVLNRRVFDSPLPFEGKGLPAVP